jgi:hypothetical protein
MLALVMAMGPIAPAGKPVLVTLKDPAPLPISTETSFDL